MSVKVTLGADFVRAYRTKGANTAAPHVYVAASGDWRLTCIVDEWRNEGTALIEDRGTNQTMVGLWRRDHGGSELGDAMLLELEIAFLPDALHDRLMAALHQAHPDWFDSYSPRTE